MRVYRDAEGDEIALPGPFTNFPDGVFECPECSSTLTEHIGDDYEPLFICVMCKHKFAKEE